MSEVEEKSCYNCKSIVRETTDRCGDTLVVCSFWKGAVVPYFEFYSRKWPCKGYKKGEDYLGGD